jgi:hypothetical protein
MVQLIERAFPGAVVGVPEAASLLFAGGFPRFGQPEAERAVQRAIFHVQHALEASFLAQYGDQALVLDRGTIDGAAYWPDGADGFFDALGTTLAAELARYDQVIYLASAGEADYLAHKATNPNRHETWLEAKMLDEKSRHLWARHHHFTLVENNRSFQRKVLEVIAIFAASVPFADAGENK